MSAGIGVFIPLELRLPPEQRKDRQHIVVHVRPGQWPAITAVIDGVVNQESRPGRAQGDQMGVILAREEVRGNFLDVADVRRLGTIEL